jgi:hypothetical protein
MRRKFAAVLAAAALMIAMLAVPAGAIAILPPFNEVDTECTNPGGHQPLGQQPSSWHAGNVQAGGRMRVYLNWQESTLQESPTTSSCWMRVEQQSR